MRAQRSGGKRHRSKLSRPEIVLKFRFVYYCYVCNNNNNNNNGSRNDMTQQVGKTRERKGRPSRCLIGQTQRILERVVQDFFVRNSWRTLEDRRTLLKMLDKRILFANIILPSFK